MLGRMKIRILMIFLITIALVGWGCAVFQPKEQRSAAESGFSWSRAAGRSLAHPGAIAGVEWLKDHYKDSDVVILDGSDVKDDTYVPHTVKGAVHVPYRDLRQGSGLAKGVTFGLEKETFDPKPLTEIFRKAGVDNDSTVVCVGQYRVDDAATLFWVLKWLGHANVRLLPVNYLKTLPGNMLAVDVTTWKDCGEKGSFTPEPDWSWYAARADVVAAMTDPMTGLWDVRPEAYFLGKKTKSIRGGSLATAENIFFGEMWTDKGASTVDWAGIEKKLAGRFTTKDGAKMRIISFCNSGHSCTVGFFAWQLGYPWAVFDASWNMMAHDGSIPAQNVEF